MGGKGGGGGGGKATSGVPWEYVRHSIPLAWQTGQTTQKKVKQGWKNPKSQVYSGKRVADESWASRKARAGFNNQARWDKQDRMRNRVRNNIQDVNGRQTSTSVMRGQSGTATPQQIGMSGMAYNPAQMWGTGQATAQNVNAQNINARDVSAQDAQARDVNAQNISARDVNAQQANQGVRDATAQNVDAQTWDQAAAERYMNPYEDQVVEQTQADMARQAAIERNRLAGQASRAGAWGGSGGALAQSEFDRNYVDRMAANVGQLRQQGYSQAQGIFGQDANRLLQAGTANQQADLQADMANQASDNQAADRRMQGQLANQQKDVTVGQANQQANLTAAQANQQKDLTTSQANQQRDIAVGTANQDKDITVGQANQNANLQADLANQQTDLDADKFNVKTSQDRVRANMDARNEARRFRGEQAMTTAQANQAADMDADKFNASLNQERRMANMDAWNETAFRNADRSMEAQRLNQAADMQSYGLAGSMFDRRSNALSALNVAGLQQQGHWQDKLNARQNRFAERRDMTFNTLRKGMGILSSGSMAHGSQPVQGGPSGLERTLGLGMQAAGTAALFMSDRRMKRDIAHIATTAEGTKLYAYRYLWDDEPLVGIMADELRETNPDAVVPTLLGDAVRYDLLVEAA